MTPEYKAYLKSDAWQKKRQDFFSFVRASGLPVQCDLCGSTKCLQVHHLTYARVFNEDMTDLHLICKDCHDKEHGIQHKRKKKKKRSRKVKLTKWQKLDKELEGVTSILDRSIIINKYTEKWKKKKSLSWNRLSR